MGRLTGKVAFVTGAARGQGRAQAVRLAEEGADIIAIDLCEQIESVPYPLASREDLAQTAKEVEALDRRVHAQQADVRDLAALQAVVERGTADLGPIDIIVANAGIMNCAPVLEMSEQQWREMIDVNLTGVFNTVRAAGPAMLAGGKGGSIIMISSAAGIKGFPMLAHYTAAKHGMVGLMKALAGELGHARVRVNTVHPTTVATPMVLDNQQLRGLFMPDKPDATAADFGAMFQTMHMLPEPWVQPGDIADAVLFLASDESKFITGQQLKVDCGFCER